MIYVLERHSPPPPQFSVCKQAGWWQKAPRAKGSCPFGCPLKGHPGRPLLSPRPPQVCGDAICFVSEEETCPNRQDTHTHTPTLLQHGCPSLAHPEGKPVLLLTRSHPIPESQVSECSQLSHTTSLGGLPGMKESASHWLNSDKARRQCPPPPRPGEAAPAHILQALLRQVVLSELLQINAQDNLAQQDSQALC